MAKEPPAVVLPGRSLKEEEAFRRAQIDPDFRAFLLSEWLRSKRTARLFVFGTVALILVTLGYTGLVHGRWAPNLLWTCLALVSFCMERLACTSIAALKAMEDKKPNQLPEPTSGLAPGRGSP